MLISWSGRSVLARTLDIGPGGLGIVSPWNPPPGTVLRVALRIPARPAGTAPVEADAEVLHSMLAPADDGFRIGLRFVALPPVMLASILNFTGPG